MTEEKKTVGKLTETIKEVVNGKVVKDEKTERDLTEEEAKKVLEDFKKECDEFDAEFKKVEQSMLDLWNKTFEHLTHKYRPLLEKKGKK
jgi:hypothetical protein